MLTSSDTVATGERATKLRRRIRLIVAFTIVYNLAEAVVAISAGTIASSGALIGFGLDSTVEVASAVAVAWQFTRTDPQRWERATLKAIAVAFFALAAYVSVDSVTALVNNELAEHSSIGITIAAVSVIVMPVVSYLERRAGRELGSASAVADSKQTLMCAYLSAAVLVGLVLNSTLGWWWADPAAALIIAVLAVKEGIEAWQGDGCALSTGRALDAGSSGDRGVHGDCCLFPWWGQTAGADPGPGIRLRDRLQAMIRGQAMVRAFRCYVRNMHVPGH